MGEAVLLGRRDRAGDELGIAAAEIDAAGDMQELLAGLALEVGPQLVRAAEERDVAGVLGVDQADHPRQPVVRALVVRGAEAVEAEDLHAAAGDIRCDSCTCRLISETEEAISSDAAAADCAFAEDCSDTAETVAESDCVISAVLVRLPADNSSSDDAVDTV